MRYKYAKEATKRNARPDTWLSGPDPLTHEKFYAWHKHRSQARYRGEIHDLTFEQWLDIWKDDEQFLNRGKSRECFVLTRKDSEGPWSVDNCEIITRYEQLKRNMAEKIERRWGRGLNAKY